MTTRGTVSWVASFVAAVMTTRGTVSWVASVVAAVMTTRGTVYWVASVVAAVMTTRGTVCWVASVFAAVMTTHGTVSWVASVAAVMTMRGTVSWDVMPCSLVVTNISEGQRIRLPLPTVCSHMDHTRPLWFSVKLGLAVSVYLKPSIRHGIVYLTTKTRVFSCAVRTSQT
jgi:hypothetical protein